MIDSLSDLDVIREAEQQRRLLEQAQQNGLEISVLSFDFTRLRRNQLPPSRFGHCVFNRSNPGINESPAHYVLRALENNYEITESKLFLQKGDICLVLDKDDEETIIAPNPVTVDFGYGVADKVENVRLTTHRFVPNDWNYTVLPGKQTVLRAVKDVRVWTGLGKLPNLEKYGFGYFFTDFAEKPECAQIAGTRTKLKF